VGAALLAEYANPLGRRPAFTLYFLGSAAAIVAFVTIPIDGSFPTYAVSFFLGFFASGQAAGYGSFLAELFPSNMRAAGQGLAYNVGRGLAALGPGFIGSRRTRSGWASRSSSSASWPVRLPSPAAGSCPRRAAR
jgi:hypothetical protein